VFAGGRWAVDQGLANDAEHQIGNFSPISDRVTS